MDADLLKKEILEELRCSWDHEFEKVKELLVAKFEREFDRFESRLDNLVAQHEKLLANHEIRYSKNESDMRKEYLFSKNKMEKNIQLVSELHREVENLQRYRDYLNTKYFNSDPNPDKLPVEGDFSKRRT